VNPTLELPSNLLIGTRKVPGSTGQSHWQTLSLANKTTPPDRILSDRKSGANFRGGQRAARASSSGRRKSALGQSSIRLFSGVVLYKMCQKIDQSMRKGDIH
jgi:hypothetical protein